MNFCSSLVWLIDAAVAGAKYGIRAASLLLAMAAARCTPEVVWRSQSAPARSVLMLSSTMVSISVPSWPSRTTATMELSRNRARIAPSTRVRRLPMDS